MATLNRASLGAPEAAHPIHPRADWPHRRAAMGFTLLELMVVVAIVALATAGVSLSLRDASATQLEREAQRMAALLESARAQSRAMGVPLYWQAQANGFAVGGQFRPWLTPGTQATVSANAGANRSANNPASRDGQPRLVLGPEPVLPPQRLSLSLQGRTLWLASDGLRPFQISATPTGTATGSTQ